MLAFVTGATGFVGSSHVARALADNGADLRLLVRQNSNLKNVAGCPTLSPGFGEGWEITTPFSKDNPGKGTSFTRADN